MAMKKLVKARTLATPKPSSSPAIPNLPLPSPPSETPVSPVHYARFLDFLKAHWAPPFSPDTLLHFLKSKLHHHPSFSQFDFHLFTWASSLDSFHHTHATFHWMARTLAATHRFPQLRSLLHLIATHPCPCSPSIFSCPHTQPIFSHAIHAFSKSSQLHHALSAFHSMTKLIDSKPDVVVFNVLIHAFVKRGNLTQALQFYREMVVTHRVKPDVFTFNILISGYCRNSQFALALEVFHEMGKAGCEPNVVTFNTLIRGMFREGRVEDAIGMAREMVQLRKGVLPEGFDCFALVEVLCGQGCAVRALEVVYELWNGGSVPSLVACIVVVDGLRGLGKIDEVQRLVKRMLDEGMVLDVVTFNCVLRDICDARRTNEANRLMLVALSKGLEPDDMTYRTLVIGYMEEGGREEGELLVNEMLDRGFIPDLASYNKLISGLSNCRRSTSRQGIGSRCGELQPLDSAMRYAIGAMLKPLD
ncbi:hypothetical protein ACSQ67_001705 [Phaseolus vulgaris]